MEFLYENHQGKILDLSKPPYILQELNFFDWGFAYESNGKLSENSYGKVKEYKCKLNVVCDETMVADDQRNESWKQSIDRLHEVIIADVIADKNGKLRTSNGAYMPCKFIASQKSGWNKRGNHVQINMTILTNHNVWIDEQTINVGVKSDTQLVSGEANEKIYPYTYPYVYPSLQNETNVFIDHYTDSHFKLIVYGPTLSVLINIADHPYQVEYPIEAGEYMIIDSRPSTPKEEKLCIVRRNGVKENIFQYRSVENSVFKKIPPGMVKIDYPRTYGIDLTVFKERSEPSWK